MCGAADFSIRGGESALEVALEHGGHVIGHPAGKLRAHQLLEGVEVVAGLGDLLAESLAPERGVTGTCDLRGTHEIVCLVLVAVLCEGHGCCFSNVARI